MTDPRPELFAAARQMLVDYLGLSAPQRVVITADTATDPAALAAIMAAAVAEGVRPLLISMPQLPFQGRLADPFLPETLAGALAQADLWIDWTFPYIAGSTLHDTVMQAGRCRYMLCSDLSAGGLLRCFGGVDPDAHHAVTGPLDTLIAEARGQEVRITTPLGTDVRFILGASRPAKPRHVQGPGMFLIPGACTLTPEVESVRGHIVVETVFHEYYTPLRDPIRLDVEGRIRAVQGGGPERRVLERALRRAGGGDYGYIIHFTHGTHPAARFTGRCFVEDMRAIGCDAVGMGLPWWVPGGGENHPDAVMSMQSMWIGGEMVARDGALVGPAPLAAAAAALAPRPA